jgi:hypothetical protein
MHHPLTTTALLMTALTAGCHAQPATDATAPTQSADQPMTLEQLDQLEVPQHQALPYAAEAREQRAQRAIEIVQEVDQQLPESTAEVPAESHYVVVSPEGHLSVDGQRQRYWAVIGKPFIRADIPDNATPEQRREAVELGYRNTDALLDRFEALGFNAIRLWNANPQPRDYELGDGSTTDSVDYLVAEAGRRGMRIWIAGLNRLPSATSEMVDIIDDPETAEAWSAAIAELAGRENGSRQTNLRQIHARIWDPRLEALALRHMAYTAAHLNRHTGLRWADDPTLAVWELSNEQWWVRRMLTGQWQNLPEFFRNSLVAQWNSYLADKYQTDDALREAWDGLLPGESLTGGTVLFTPMARATDSATTINDSNPQALAALQNLEQRYSRDDFADQRASDVLEFLVDLLVTHKQREHAALEPLGRSTAMSPWIYDTGIGYEIQSQYLHQQADAVSHNAYTNGWGPTNLDERLAEAAEETDEQREMFRTIDAERIVANDGHWVNWLRKPPGMHQGVPWMEHNRVPGRPYLIYETQIQQPAKYRADYPLRLAALASIQDWDWISWHYFASHDNVATDDNPWDRPMDITTGSHPQGYHFTYDEVQQASMRAAAHIFRHEQLDPAAEPTLYIYGRDYLTEADSMQYAGSYGMTGLGMNYTSWAHGMRLLIDPDREGVTVVGPTVDAADRRNHNPYAATDQITYDHQAGYLMFDSPAAVAWTGMFADYPGGDTVQFNHHDLTLSDVVINNPEGSYDPVTEDEQYFAFALHSLTDQPLDQTDRASISLVSTSYNTGYTYTPGDGGVRARGTQGTLPVLETAVGATLTSPALTGMSYRMLDWHLNPIAEGTIDNGTLQIPADEAVFVIELTRNP